MMQTWLPVPNFKDSARSLTGEDLRTQRLQVLQLIEEFHQIPREDTKLPSSYTRGHLDEDSHVYKMWYGYELQLIEYGVTCCEELAVRMGKSDPIYDKLAMHYDWAETEEAPFSKPNWFGDVDFHISHQAALVRINKRHYSQFFKVVDTTVPLVWPESDLLAQEN